MMHWTQQIASEVRRWHSHDKNNNGESTAAESWPETPEDKKGEGIPSINFSKYSVKPQVWCAVSYDVKVLYIHANRRRKRRKGPAIKHEYRLELQGVNAKELAYVVEEEFGLFKMLELRL